MRGGSYFELDADTRCGVGTLDVVYRLLPLLLTAKEEKLLGSMNCRGKSRLKISLSVAELATLKQSSPSKEL